MPTRDFAWARVALIWVDDAVVAAWAAGCAVGRAARPSASSTEASMMRVAPGAGVSVDMRTWFLRGRKAPWRPPRTRGLTGLAGDGVVDCLRLGVVPGSGKHPTGSGRNE